MSAAAVSAGMPQIPQVNNGSWELRAGTHWAGVLWNLANVPIAYTIAKIFAKTIPSPSIVNCWPSFHLPCSFIIFDYAVPVPWIFAASNVLLLTKEICYWCLPNQSEANLKKRSDVIIWLNLAIAIASVCYFFFTQFNSPLAVIVLQALPHILNWTHDIWNSESWVLPLTDYDLEEQEIVFLKKKLNKENPQPCNNEKILKYIEGKDCKSKIKILSNALAKLKKAEKLLNDERQKCSSFGLSDELVSIPVFKDMASAVHCVGRYRTAPQDHTRQGVDDLPLPDEQNLEFISQKIKNAQNGKERALARIDTLKRMIAQALIDELEIYLPRSDAKNLNLLLYADRWLCKRVAIIFGAATLLLAFSQYPPNRSFDYLPAYFALVFVLDFLKRSCMSYYRLSSDVLAGKDQSQTGESAKGFYRGAIFQHICNQKDKDIHGKDQTLQKERAAFELEKEEWSKKYRLNEHAQERAQEIGKFKFKCEPGGKAKGFVYLRGEEQANQSNISKIALSLVTELPIIISIQPQFSSNKNDGDLYSSRAEDFASKVLEASWEICIGGIGAKPSDLLEQGFPAFLSIGQRLKTFDLELIKDDQVPDGVSLSAKPHYDSSTFDVSTLRLQDEYLRHQAYIFGNDKDSFNNIWMAIWMIRLNILNQIPSWKKFLQQEKEKLTKAQQSASRVVREIVKIEELEKVVIQTSVNAGLKQYRLPYVERQIKWIEDKPQKQKEKYEAILKRLKEEQEQLSKL